MYKSADNQTDSEDSTLLGVHGKHDMAYMQSLSAAVVHRSPRHIIAVVIIIATFIAAALVWMGWAEIDVVVRGSGKVAPVSQVQIVQSLEGGIVSDILVTEGQAVNTGDPLLKISDIAFSSSFEENRLLYLDLSAQSSRLNAEAYGLPFKPNEEVILESPELVQAEKSLYNSHQKQLEESLKIHDAQSNQLRSELTEIKSKINQLKRSLNLVKKEIVIKKPLKLKGIISEVEFLQLQQREAEMEGEIQSAELSIPRINSTIEEAGFNKQKEILDFQNKAKQELNRVNAEIGRIKETQTALQDRVKRTTLRSPVNGIVQRIFTNTVGGVINSGSDVIEIIPQEDYLLIEANIKPADIAYIHIGQSARLKFSAYDFAIHGNVEGSVIFVSADTITNENGDSFYLVRIKPANPFIGDSSEQLSIKVGMTVEADIITAKKTILSYLTEPVHRGFNKALREQ